MEHYFTFGKAWLQEMHIKYVVRYLAESNDSAQSLDTADSRYMFWFYWNGLGSFLN